MPFDPVEDYQTVKKETSQMPNVTLRTRKMSAYSKERSEGDNSFTYNSNKMDMSASFLPMVQIVNQASYNMANQKQHRIAQQSPVRELLARQTSEI